MRQCPDCEEKDRVVIAGKVFCANCGAPWQTADKAEEAKYLQKVGLGTTPAAPPTPAGGPTMSTEQADPIAAALKAAGGSVAASAPAPAPVPNSVPAPPAPPTPPISAAPPAPTPAPPPAVTPSPAAVTPPVSEPVKPPATPAIPAPSAPAPAAPVTVPMGVPVAAPNPSPQPTISESSPTAPAPVAQVVQASPRTFEANTNDLKTETASEIPSLDSKEDPVLSDSQFSELSKVNVPPASPALSTSQRSMNDIVVPAVPPVAAAAPTPAPVATPTLTQPSANTPTTPTPNMTTVAGVTMSREDALKLALGDEVGADVARPEDKEAKKGPAKPTAVVMSVIALILLGAYLWQVNYPNFALRLAAMRAGVSSGMPGYIPTGWSDAKDVKSSQGTLSYDLTKNSDKLTITESKSNWDSQAVLEQHVLKNSTDYLALQAQGLTIYMYGKNQVAWVNHGSFYTMTGDHDINQDDMIRIATSL